jgi:hypothetical protein
MKKITKGGHQAIRAQLNILEEDLSDIFDYLHECKNKRLKNQLHKVVSEVGVFRSMAIELAYQDYGKDVYADSIFLLDEELDLIPSANKMPV